MNKIFLLICLLLFQVLKGQDWNDYKQLKSTGELPKDVTSLSTDKYNEDKKQLENSNDKRKLKKAKDQFLLESNFHVDNMLRNGLVLFGDPISNYVDKVANELLKNEPTLRKELHFHVLKSPVVNAMATHEGYIFVTMGLISKLNNEAELAYILSHEIVHYVKKHSIKKVENSTLKYSKSNISDDEKKLSKCSYSRELESEADLEGLNYFTKSKYDLTAVHTVFDVLSFSNIPFEDKKFETSFLENEYFKLDSLCVLKETKEIEYIEEDNDEIHTHPNIAKRRTASKEKISSLSNEGRTEFLVSSLEEFKNVQKQARFELSLLYLNKGMFGSCFYNSWLLLQKDPSSKFLNGMIIRSLYGLSKFIAAKKTKLVLNDYLDVEGEEQQIFHIFQQIESKPMLSIAIFKTLEYLKLFPNDKDIEIILNDMVYTLVNDLNVSLTDYHSEMKTKLSTIDTSNYKVALIDHKNNPLLINAFENANIKKKETADFLAKLERARKKENRELFKLPENQIHAQKFDYKNFKYALGINKINAIQPIYIYGDARKKNPFKYQASEKTLLRCMDEMKEESQKLNMEVSIFSPYLTKSTEMDKFNQYQELKNTYSFLNFINENEIKMEYFYTSQVDELRQKTGSDHLMMFGVSNIIIKKNVFVLVAMMFLIYPIPYSVFVLATPQYRSQYANIVYDLKLKKKVMFTEYALKNNASSTYRRFYFYHMFNQIQRKSK